MEEIRPLLAAFDSFRPRASPRPRLMLESPGAVISGQGPAAPLFLASVSLSVLVYFAVWLAPEPLFSKAFAKALTGAPMMINR